MKRYFYCFIGKLIFLLKENKKFKNRDFYLVEEIYGDISLYGTTTRDNIEKIFGNIKIEKYDDEIYLCNFDFKEKTFMLMEKCYFFYRATTDVALLNKKRHIDKNKLKRLTEEEICIIIGWLASHHHDVLTTAIVKQLLGETKKIYRG